MKSGSNRQTEELPRGVLALLSKMRAKGKVALEELSVKGRLALLEHDAKERGSRQLQEPERGRR